MLRSIKFGTTWYPLTNPPANTIVLAVDPDEEELYLIDCRGKKSISKLATSYLFDSNGKIKSEYIDAGIITKVSQLENDVGYITNSTSNLVYYLTKTETLTAIANLNNKKADQSEVDDLSDKVNALQGAYIYIGKIDSDNPSQEELTEAAIDIKGELNAGYVIIDNLAHEWYYNGTQWLDFGQASVSMSYNDLTDKPFIPTNMSDLNNDIKVTTESDVMTIINDVQTTLNNEIRPIKIKIDELQEKIEELNI